MKETQTTEWILKFQLQGEPKEHFKETTYKNGISESE